MLSQSSPAPLPAVVLDGHSSPGPSCATAAGPQQLIISTHRALYSFDGGSCLWQLSTGFGHYYGVVPLARGWLLVGSQSRLAQRNAKRNAMTKESHAYNALQKREDSMTKVIQSFQSSDLQPLNARLLRGEVDPWETLPLNNPPFLPAPVFRYIVDFVFSLVFS